MTWLSCDPGSHATALIAWEGDRPRAWLLAQPGAKAPLEDRLRTIVTAFRSFGRAQQIELVVIEKALSTPKRPAPEATVTYRRLCRVAKDEGWQVVSIHPSTVLASVRPRGTKGWASKDILATGVKMLYPDYVKPDMAQDVLDALAVGRCYLNQTEEAELIARELA